MDLGYIAATIYGVLFMFFLGVTVGGFMSEGRDKK